MQDHQQEFLEVLVGAVRRESPTEGDPNDLIACRDYFAGLFREIGFHVTTVNSLDPRFADHLLVEYGAGAGRAAFGCEILSTALYAAPAGARQGIAAEFEGYRHTEIKQHTESWTEENL